MNTAHHLRGTWAHDVDRFIVMTRFERDKFVEGGFPADKISVKPHFVYDTSIPHDESPHGLLYVGRLTPDKGIPMLLEAWSGVDSIPLTIAGEGPLAEDIKRMASEHPNLHYVGQESNWEVHELMRRSSIVVITSEWYETFCRVVVEAFAESTPVLASNIGALGELVTAGVTGLHFEPGNAQDLAKKIQWAADHPIELRGMGENGRREYEETYTPERNYTLLMNIYDDAVAQARGAVNSGIAPGHMPVRSVSEPTAEAAPPFDMAPVS
jgi:glycosyltransferase involved in cell wall biosynthesis